MRRLTTLLLIALTVLGVSACGQASAPREPLRVGFNLAWPGFAPLLIADQQQYYPAAVELSTFMQLYDTYRAFEQRRIDIAATTMFDALRLADEGIPLKIIMVADYSNGADGIVARDTILDVAGLKGKKVGAAVGDLGQFVLLAALDQAGLTEEDVEVVNLGPEDAAKAYANGEIDAAVLWDPLLSEAAAGAGSHKIFTSDKIPALVSDVLIVHSAVAEQRPDEVAAVIAGWNRGVQFLHDQPEASAALLSKPLNATPEAVTASFAGIEIVDLDANQRLFEQGAELSIWTAYHATANFMAKHDLLKHEAPAAQTMLDPAFLSLVGGQ